MGLTRLSQLVRPIAHCYVFNKIVTLKLSRLYRLACLKRHVKTLDRVCESTNRHEVNAALGIVAYGIEGDAAARLDFILSVH